MRGYVTSRGHAGVSFGCLGMIAFGFLYLMAAMVWAVGVFVIVVGLALLLAVAYGAVGADWLACQLSARWRARRALHGPIRAPQEVEAVVTRTIHHRPPRRRS